MSKRLRLAYFIFALLFLAAVSAQVIMAGLALFWRSSVWESHVGVGHLAAGVPLLMLILALAGRLPMRMRPYTGLLFLGVVLQAELFPLIREVSGLASAYHPFLAMLLFWGGGALAHRSWVLARSPEAVSSLSLEYAEPALGGPSSIRVAPRCDTVTGVGCA
jgi:hypothetical protein